jgi:hypothetical protein
MTVGDLLASSRRAHLDFLMARRDGRTAEIRPAILKAHGLRQEAQAQDPTHLDTAWRDDLRAQFATVSPAILQDLDIHDDLLNFYASELAKS